MGGMERRMEDGVEKMSEIEIGEKKVQVADEEIEGRGVTLRISLPSWIPMLSQNSTTTSLSTLLEARRNKCLTIKSLMEMKRT